MAERPIVYLTQSVNGHDYRGLHQIGEVRAVFTRSLFPDVSDADQAALWPAAFSALWMFRPGIDVIAPDGDPVLIAVCIAVLCQSVLLKGVPFHVAKWDQKLGGYYFISVGQHFVSIGEDDDAEEQE